MVVDTGERRGQLSKEVVGGSVSLDLEPFWLMF